MASRGAATEWPVAVGGPLPPTGRAGGGCGGPAPRAPAAQPLATLAMADDAMTRVCPTPQLRRVQLAAGAGVCLHRIGASFTVEVHGHDDGGGLLLSMTQAEAAALAQRLMMFAQLVPGFAPGEGL
jgi:hypothetical protein